jgi:hypothetical protein
MVSKTVPHSVFPVAALHILLPVSLSVISSLSPWKLSQWHHFEQSPFLWLTMILDSSLAWAQPSLFFVHLGSIPCESEYHHPGLCFWVNWLSRIPGSVNGLLAHSHVKGRPSLLHTVRWQGFKSSNPKALIYK